jgi:hypothetical protein
MATDAYGPLLQQAGLAGTASAAVMQNLITRSHDHIGDQLFHRRILLSLGARHEKMIPRLQKNGKVAVDFGVQPVKGTEFIKKGPADDEDLFGGRHNLGDRLKAEEC